jgi:hypothetical protein
VLILKISKDEMLAKAIKTAFFHLLFDEQRGKLGGVKMKKDHRQHA